jgi:UDP-2,3-diacylglucosamine pyrophosphatase LpxH
MNAYELADIVDRWAYKESAEYLTDAANMLRQQADRIAHLEMLLANRNEIIDKLDLTTSQIKQLSDEEITEVLNDENIAEYHQGNWLVLPYAFARAILKKASEK